MVVEFKVMITKASFAMVKKEKTKQITASIVASLC